MAMTPDQIDALPVYTSAQHLKVWKKADIELATGGRSYAVPGRSLNRNDAAEVRAQIKYWEDVVAIEEAGNNGGGLALVRFGERV